MSWLDGLLGRIFDNGTEIDLSKGLNFAGGLRAGLNPSSKIVEVVIADGGVSADEAGAAANGAAIGVVLSVAFDGVSQDVPLFTSAPYAFRVVDAWTKVSTAVGGASVQWRSQSGGGGSALSASMSAASTGTVRESTTASPSVALSSGCHLRLSATGVVGEAFLLVTKT